MLRDLERNEHHHRPHKFELENAGIGVALFVPLLEERIAEVSFERDLMSTYLNATVIGYREERRRVLLQSIHCTPVLTPFDLARSLLDADTLLLLVPYLSETDRDYFRQATILFMELCVLEDKLTRLLHRAKSQTLRTLEMSALTHNDEVQESSAQAFVDELLCCREWDSNEHPYWLVFEFEGRLQIRPEQHVVAQHLIQSPHRVCQLNTGRGKTRVILPMLLLYYRDQFLAASRECPEKSRIARAHFLSPLLSETLQFMHRVLTAGVLQLPFIEQPFDRQTMLGRHELLRIQDARRETARLGGFIIVAPEHRLSLELKRLELAPELMPKLSRSHNNCDGESTLTIFDDLLGNDRYVDIFDESDAVLHHSYHLVYAEGATARLEGGIDRWISAEALLGVLNNPKSTRVKRVLKASPELWCSAPECLARLGAYNGFRLKASNAVNASESFAYKDKDVMLKLRRALVEDMIDQAPFEMSWLKAMLARNKRTDKKRGCEARSSLINVICDARVDASPEAVQALLPGNETGSHQYNQLVALRGLLAFGVLEHCLQKRNCVDYGLPLPGTRNKALAIPFSAADIPAERSEFCHPDVSIVLTLLAYYYAGLGHDDVKQAFMTLLKLDEAEQKHYYDEWFASVRDGLTCPIERAQLENVSDIVLENHAQLELLCSVFKYSRLTINFFLNMCVFPRDTKQYPSRLARSAWDLAKGSSNMGFSGTNDCHRLLPLGVQQHEPDEPSLRATNGRMLDLVLKFTHAYDVLSEIARPVVDKSPAIPTWQVLVQHALKRKCHALIDTGALLAGVPTHVAAEYLASQRHEGVAFTGVTYFDTRLEWNVWVVLDGERHMITPLAESSIHERETFVIFDEARARGSDMKLLPNAMAILTLGPRMTKDKLMQGAGRMRQLGDNQSLWLVSTVEIEASVTACAARGNGNRTTTQTNSQPASLTVRDVLQWVMESTQEQCTEGILEWAESGSHFCATSTGGVSAELTDDDWSLVGQYSGAQSMQLVDDIVKERIRQRHGHSVFNDGVSSLLGLISARSKKYGCDTMVETTAYGEECERELHVEAEQEEEREVECKTFEPFAEEDWECHLLLSAQSVHDVIELTKAKSLAKGVNLYMPRPLPCQEVMWHDSKLFGTNNFWNTLNGMVPSPDTSWNAYMRLVDALVMFADGTMLMVSEREADAITKMLVTTQVPDSVSGFALVHLALMRSAVARCGEEARLSHVELVRFCGSPLTNRIPMFELTACGLFNGETEQLEKVSSSDLRMGVHEQALRGLIGPMHPPPREVALRDWVADRRFAKRWTRSHLHKLAKQMDLEDNQRSVNEDHDQTRTTSLT